MTDKEQKTNYSALTGFHRAVPIILSAFALFMGLSLLVPDMGSLGSWLSRVLRGLFARGAYAVPALMILQACFYPSDVGRKRVISRLIFSILTTVAISCLCYAISYFGSYSEVVFSVSEFYENGKEGIGGGAVGGIVSKGLTDLISPVGVIILAAAVLALYVSYFFAGGMKAVRSFGFAILRAVISFFALIERGLKAMVRSSKTRKERKKARKDEKMNYELSKDDFFGVDDGMAALEISELGIKQTRNRSDLEQNPTLQEKMNPKSAVNGAQSTEGMQSEHTEEDAPTEERRRKIIYSQSFSMEDGLMETTERVERRGEAIIIEAEEQNEQEQEAQGEEWAETVSEDDTPAQTVSEPEASVSSSIQDGESAEAVFGSGFDPFSLAMSEKLANKPSSKAAPAPTVTEDISELTEEELERARRIKAFEERKRAIVDMHAQREATPVSNRGEFTGKAKTIDFREAKGEVLNTPDVAEEISVTIEKTEKPKEEAPRPIRLSFTEMGFGAEEAPSASYGTASSHVATPVRPAYTESINTNRAQTVERTDSEQRQNPYRGVLNAQSRATVSEPAPAPQSSAATGYARAAEFASRAQSAEPAPVRVAPPVSESYSNRASENQPKVESYNFGSSDIPRTEAKPEVKAEPSVFEFTENNSTENSAQTSEQTVSGFGLGGERITERTESVTVERTPIREATEPSRAAFGIDSDTLTETVEEDEEELSAEEFSSIEEEIEEQTEIPPEKQNPVVMGYRDMFPDLRDSDEEDDTEEEEQAVTEHSDNDYTYADEDDTEDADDTEEDEDDCPFDGAVDTEEDSLADIVEEMEDAPTVRKKADYSNYKTPPLELLGLSGSQDEEEITAEIRANTAILIETLASFNVTASIKGVDRGPRITRYEVVPAKGVKVNAITHLFDDISLNLAAEGIRMEAPIPGKSAIGFEIPNKHPADVRLRELLECEEFTSSKSNTFVCIGKDVAGKPVFGDIAKFPHCLVAGATGMGKSVCINSIMISILYKARPDQVKFIMIDPKKVEFKLYTGIPHLLIPVITESKQAAGALMWAVEEMERRYDIIEKHSLRNIEGYNEKVALDPSLGEPLPKIVIVIDELNDLMMQVRDPVEDLIMRIAQKARAAGIHLIIGTQRPDVKVITGTIKANINTRISCKVTSVVDSRTILEMAGAEKLLNKGDMLFKPTDKTKPIRVQGAFVKDSEAEAVMEFLRSEVSGEQYDDDIFKEINKAAQKCGNKKGGGGASMADDGEDDGDSPGYYSDQQFLDAVELAIRSRKVSTSLLQRKLSIGYGKAAKYIDQMMDIGIVSEPNGQKPRDVLITLDEWQDKLSRVSID